MFPNILHQIWIGNNNPPAKWMNTFRTFCETRDQWSYNLWRDAQLESFDFKFLRHVYDSEPTMQGKADIARLEILYEKGGVYVDADTCLLDPSLFEELIIPSCHHESQFLLTAWEHDDKQVANGFIACTPHNPIIRDTMTLIANTYEDLRAYNPPWKVTGPVPFTKAILSSSPGTYKILPSYRFYPIHWEGLKIDQLPTDVNILRYLFADSCTMHYGYTTNNLSNSPHV